MREKVPWQTRFKKYENRGKDDECWIWSGTKMRSGYGLLKCDDKLRIAHRIAFEIANGYQPTQQVLHRCDVRACVNPAHLYEGTQAQNMHDRHARGGIWKVPRGPEHYRWIDGRRAKVN